MGKKGRTKVGKRVEGGQKREGLRVGNMGGYGWEKGRKGKGGIIGKDGKGVRVKGWEKG